MSRHDCARCDWTPAESEGVDQLVAHALEAGHPLCVVCRRSLTVTEIQSCLRCVGAIRSLLAEIVDLSATLLLPSPKSPRMDPMRGGSSEPPLPGGDALVMLAPGAPSHWGDPSDPPAVAFELGTWEDDWRGVRREGAAPYAVTMCGAAGYLARRVTWAASHHPAFDEFAADLRRIVSRLRTAAATGDFREKGAPCFDCDTLLERRSGEETRECPRCHRVYSEREYWFAVRADLEAEAASG